MMGKLLGGIAVVGAVGVFGYDGAQVFHAKSDLQSAAAGAAGAAAHTIAITHDEAKGRVAANGMAQQHHAVLTVYHYDPVAAKVKVTLSGSIDSLVLHYVNRGLVKDVTASATASPG